jgi:hypothetical protein
VAYVLPRLSTQFPSANLVYIPVVDVTLPILADPYFNSPGSIDIILGADIYGLLLCQGIQRVPGTQLVSQSIVLGSIVSGSIFSDSARWAEANSHHKGPCTAVSKHNYSILERNSGGKKWFHLLGTNSQ